MIAAQPQDTSYLLGDTPVALTVDATVSDGGTLTYQWYISTTNTNAGGNEIFGETTYRYTPPISNTGTVYYYCEITNTNLDAPGDTITTTATDTAKVTVSILPSIEGDNALTLTEGYAATSTSAFTITGTPDPTLTKTTGDPKITWNAATKKLDIAAGLTADTYLVTLKAENGALPHAEHTFGLTP